MSSPNTSTTSEEYSLDKLDKILINLLQHGLPVCQSPFAAIADEVDSTEVVVIEKIENLLNHKILSRFGPMYDAACFGGAFTLAALSVPDERFEEVTQTVNSFEQIAHNYKRNNKFNMWFVIATESQNEIDEVIEKIEQQTQLNVLNTPKLEEFYVGLYLPV
jgi:DNA-binding Lrp family transcriptional regulator